MQTVTSDPATWGARNAHDPTVVRGDDGLWYMFSTDAAVDVDAMPVGAHVRTSSDLVTWTFQGTALGEVPAPAREWSNAEGLWAPDVIRWRTADGSVRWHMYYSASTFGSRTSAIGLATAETLSGPWTDRGIVVATQHERDGHNAIDAAIAFDRDGRAWMIYGSFFGGIHAVELDRSTGMRVRDEKGTLIARRPSDVDGAIEGAYVVYRPEEDRFVLFVSYDSLVNTYSVRVGAAKEITGPYLDAAGRDLTDPAAGEAEAVGTKVLGGYRFPGGTGFIAPGHNSIFSDGDATYMVHHVRLADAPRQHEAQIRRVHWTAGGWPLVSPHPYAGAAAETLDAPIPASGDYDAVRFDPRVSGMIEAQPVRLATDAVSAGAPVATRLALRHAQGPDAEDAATIVLDGVVFGAYDPVAKRTVLAFAGIDESGVVWSGSQRVPA
ncbi:MULTISPECIES: arabinan endo-1,5-alpha-L-arabinosidase [unclassified Microbacterium]|uniref:arabinan endo-1,5-alpha-L-arabinosidase n=1 Tax=unclassified Microbacterium TaxID=2609290 RepID=UPI0012FC1901|nr:arabinan endo-1,5-alpha-L-arabinosidase [Microbacterium sp. MAH-37]MVQ43545.1 family 43 glycosylhydrolase [Microbacterium sp. MAH-37]